MKADDKDFLKFIQLLEPGPIYNQGSAGYADAWIYTLSAEKRAETLSKLAAALLQNQADICARLVPAINKDPRSVYLWGLLESGYHFQPSELKILLKQAVEDFAYSFAAAIIITTYARFHYCEYFIKDYWAVLNYFAKSKICDRDLLRMAIVSVDAIMTYDLCSWEGMIDYQLMIDDFVENCAFDGFARFPGTTTVLTCIMYANQSEALLVLDNMITFLKQSENIKLKKHVSLAAADRMSAINVDFSVLSSRFQELISLV